MTAGLVVLVQYPYLQNVIGWLVDASNPRFFSSPASLQAEANLGFSLAEPGFADHLAHVSRFASFFIFYFLFFIFYFFAPQLRNFSSAITFLWLRSVPYDHARYVTLGTILLLLVIPYLLLMVLWFPHNPPAEALYRVIPTCTRVLSCIFRIRRRRNHSSTSPALEQLCRPSLDANGWR